MLFVGNLLGDLGFLVIFAFTTLIAFLAFIVFSYQRLLRYLHIFQQDEYDASRFLPWLVNTASFDKRVSAALFLFWVMTRTANEGSVLQADIGLVALLFIVAAVVEYTRRRGAKKKLVLTSRAKRILGLSLVLSICVGAVAAHLGGSLKWLVAVQLIPFLLILANWLLSPIERYIQNGFRTAAEDRLRQVAPKTVGITGSFGKTSVKHILGHVLQMNTNTLFTPGSVNTVMGIARIINERLADNCRFFLVEMGAYGIGSINRLCKFTPPDVGLITSIGEAHYERFKDLDTVARAKFELAEAVAARDNLMVIDESVLEQAYAGAFVDGNRNGFMIVGPGETADVRVLSNEQTAEGLNVTIAYDGTEHTLFAPLFGIHHGRNMALAFAMATRLGIPTDRIIAALRSTPQIAHRLEVKSHASGAAYIDDAYNANPAGISGGLNLLQTLRRENGRRIIVTPGVAELGARHDEIHRELGGQAAHLTDITVAVRPDRIPTFVSGFKEAATGAELISFETFAEAQDWINQNLTASDVILIANDLPDLLERTFVT